MKLAELMVLRYLSRKKWFLHYLNEKGDSPAEFR